MREHFLRHELFLHDQRHPQIRLESGLTSLKQRRCDAHDGKRVMVEVDNLADRGIKSAEVRLPKSVADNHDRSASWSLLFLREKQPAAKWTNSEHFKIVGRSLDRPYSLWLTQAR